MVDDQHDNADDVTDADDDFEAAVGNFAPGLLARVRSGALMRGMCGAVAAIPVAARNRNVADAQSRAVFDAD
jgi:hypothetical protein